jgi:hypothetical protein
VADLNVERKRSTPILPILLGLLLLAALAYFLLNRGDTDDTNDGTGTPTADSTVAAP